MSGASGAYVTALARLAKAVKSHAEAGFPPCPECDAALADAETALLGLRFADTMQRIKDAEDAAYRVRDTIIRASRSGDSAADRP